MKNIETKESRGNNFKGGYADDIKKLPAGLDGKSSG
jgi:hypothetical protein